MNKAIRLFLLFLGIWASRAFIGPLPDLSLGTAIWPGQRWQADTRAGLAQEQATATVDATAAPIESPTPAPTQTPQPTATAEPVEFAVLKIEPTRISRENGGTLSIYGSGFGPGIAVRLVGYGLLDATVLNPTAIKAVVPPGLSEGRYGVEVIQSNGESTRLGNAVRIRSSIPEPTDTPEPGPPLAFARPELVIQSAETDPSPIRPQSAFSLRLEVVNHGDYTATNVRLALSSTDLAVPKEGSNLVILDKLDPEQAETLELVLVLTDSASGGYTSLPVTLNYSDYYRRDYTSEQSVGINVSDSAAGQPLVLLSSYETRPTSLSPGDAFSLRLQLSNVGGSNARQLLITLGGQEASDTRPFAILGSGNVRFVQELNAGESIDLEMGVMLDGSAESGVYNLPVSLTYEGEGGGASKTENQVVNLLVSRRPNLRVDYYQQLDTGLIGQPLELPIEVVNIGRDLVNVSTIQVSGDNLQVEEGSAFIGALDGGTSGSIDARVVPEQSGTLAVVVTVNYLDDFNQPRTIMQSLSVQVEQPEPTPQAAGTGGGEAASGLWSRVMRFLRGLIGLGS